MKEQERESLFVNTLMDLCYICNAVLFNYLNVQLYLYLGYKVNITVLSSIKYVEQIIIDGISRGCQVDSRSLSLMKEKLEIPLISILVHARLCWFVQ